MKGLAFISCPTAQNAMGGPLLVGSMSCRTWFACHSRILCSRRGHFFVKLKFALTDLSKNLDIRGINMWIYCVVFRQVEHAWVTFAEHIILSYSIPNKSKKFSVLMLNIRMSCVHIHATALLAIHQLVRGAVFTLNQSFCSCGTL